MARQTPRRLKKTGKLWIFCEGNTERRYFENLRVFERPRIKIRTKISDTTAEQIVDEAIKFSGTPEYDKERDKLVCVFDKDDETQNSDIVLANAKRKAGSETLLVYSNPSFEYWIMCHEGYYNSSSMDQREAYELVKTKLGIDTKKEFKLYEKTKKDLDKAKEHAKRIQKVHEDTGVELISRKPTPLTLVYKIIELIEEFK